MENDAPEMKTLALHIDYIRKDISDIKAKLDKDYVHRSEFEPIQRIVYGVVAVMGISVIGALLALVVNR